MDALKRIKERLAAELMSAAVAERLDSPEAIRRIVVLNALDAMERKADRTSRNPARHKKEDGGPTAASPRR